MLRDITFADLKVCCPVNLVSDLCNFSLVLKTTTSNTYASVSHCLTSTLVLLLTGYAVFPSPERYVEIAEHYFPQLEEKKRTEKRNQRNKSHTNNTQHKPTECCCTLFLLVSLGLGAFSFNSYLCRRDRSFRALPPSVSHQHY